MEVTIRKAEIEDAPALLAIYADYVLQTAVTFEYAVPSLQEFQDRMVRILQHDPYLVVESDGQILGYAYASKFRERPAYAWNAEMTIYLKMGLQKKGIGKKLYALMEEILKAQGIIKTIAVIALPTDAYTNFGSMQFHEKMGYRIAGRMDYCGFKFNRWYTTLFMEKQIGIPRANMPPKKDFEEIREKFHL